MVDKFPMGKSFSCSLGTFELPTQILGVRLFSGSVEFDCEDGIYQANAYLQTKEPLTIKKVIDKKAYINATNKGKITKRKPKKIPAQSNASAMESVQEELQ